MIFHSTNNKKKKKEKKKRKRKKKEKEKRTQKNFNKAPCNNSNLVHTFQAWPSSF